VYRDGPKSHLHAEFGLYFRPLGLPPRCRGVVTCVCVPCGQDGDGDLDFCLTTSQGVTMFYNNGTKPPLFTPVVVLPGVTSGCMKM
jgi:hypothetical protein